jgi:hypothetical protein
VILTEPRMTITEEKISGLRALALSNAVLRLVVVPQLGGKIISMCRIDSGNEWLLPPKNPEQPLRMPRYGDGFEQHWAYGFDECFPTVAACLYNMDERVPLLIPDHGELWSSPWELSLPGDPSVVLAKGIALPYLFTRSITLHDSTARFDYTLENTGDSTFQYLWSAHPLLRVFEGDQILLPENVAEMRVEHSHGNRLGRSDGACSWPVAKTSTRTLVHLNTVHDRTSGSAEKLFTSRLTAGYCALRSSARSEMLTFSFDAAEVPYLGLWTNEGGSPAESAEKDFTVALEPCLAPFDSLADAIRSRVAPSIPPGETQRWHVEMTVSRLPESAA